MVFTGASYPSSYAQAQEYQADAFPVFIQVTSPATGLLGRLPAIDQSALTISRFDGSYIAENGWLVGTAFRTNRDSSDSVCDDPTCARERAPIAVSSSRAPAGANDFNNLLKTRQRNLDDFSRSRRLSVKARIDNTRIQEIPEPFQKLVSDMLAHASLVLRSEEMEALKSTPDKTLENAILSLIDVNRAALVAAIYDFELQDVVGLASQSIAQDIKGLRIKTPKIRNPFFQYQEVSINDPVLSMRSEETISGSYSKVEKIVREYCQKSIPYWTSVVENRLFTENDKITIDNWNPQYFRNWRTEFDPVDFVSSECVRFQQDIAELKRQIGFAADLAFERLSHPTHRNDQTEAVVRSVANDFLRSHDLADEDIEAWTQTGILYYNRIEPFLAEQILRNERSRSGFNTARQQAIQGLAGSGAIGRSEAFLASIAGAAANEMALTLFAVRPFRPLNLRQVPVPAEEHLNFPGFDFDYGSSVALEAGEHLNPLYIDRAQPDYSELDELVLKVENGEFHPAKAAREARRWHARVQELEQASRFQGYNARLRTIVEEYLERLEGWQEVEVAHETLQEMVSSAASFNYGRGIDGVQSKLIFDSAHAWLPNDTRVDTILVSQGAVVLAGQPIIIARHKYRKRVALELDPDEFHENPVRVGDTFRSASILETSTGEEIELHIDVSSIDFAMDRKLRIIGTMYPVVATSSLVAESSFFDTYSIISDYLCALFSKELGENSCLDIETIMENATSTRFNDIVVSN